MVSMADKIAGKITKIERLKSSVNGNPRFMIEITTPNGAARSYATAVDASVAYEIENREHRDHDHLWHINGRNQIDHVEPYVIKVNEAQLKMERTMRD